MFTETKILKKLIKNAYKGSGLHVEHTDKGWLAISGWWWRLEIGYLELSNEIKAQLVECIGEIPEPGEAYLYIKRTDPQSEIPGTTYINLLEKWTQCQTEYSITNVVLRTADDFVAVLQGGSGCEIIPGWGVDLVRSKANDDECITGSGRSDSTTPYMIWADDEMAIGILKRGTKYQGEREFLEAVDECVLDWDFEIED